MINKIEFGGAKVSIITLQKPGPKGVFVKLLIKEVKSFKVFPQGCFRPK
jgi:hypothetical protein